MLLLAPAHAQDRPDGDTKGGPEVLEVPAGEAPRVDGRCEEGEWKGATEIPFRRGDLDFGKGLLKRAGRDLHLGLRIEDSPFALSFRFHFLDPVSQRRVVLLVTPLHPPLSPVAAFLQRPDARPERLNIAVCQARFDFASPKRFDAELRIPLDLLEIGRTKKGYNFSADLRDLTRPHKVLAAYPMAEEGPTAGAGMARFVPMGDWGADAPVAGKAPREDPAIQLLSAIGAEQDWAQGKKVGKPPARVLSGFLGQGDGRRREDALANLERRLQELIAGYPDYVSLRANMVRVLTGRNKFREAVAMLDEIRARFPMLRENRHQVMVQVELLRNQGRFEEALGFIAKNGALLGGGPGLEQEKASLTSLARNWKYELEYRKAEAERDDLPRVRLETNRGDIVLELFEDDAPNAVASFIRLVESGFYAGTRFHWVESGGRALGGDSNSRDKDPHNDGYGDPGYTIETEPGRRLNWGFTVALADKRRTRRTPGSTFVIHITPLPARDGIDTVFGRVIEGHDTVRRLSYYDTIESARVVRKRGHGYEVVKRAPAR